MEILHSNAKRTVLVTLDDSKDGDAYCAHLANDFNVVRASSAEECLAIMAERPSELSAVIIDVDMAQEDDCAFLDKVSENKRFDTIPVLIASRRTISEADMRCLEKGAFDFILPPHHLGLTKQRIENAVRMKRASTFYEIESILRQLPSNIFLKDAEGRYVFMTHYWHHIKRDDDPNWTIRGKTDLEIRRDRENAVKAMEADREILRTGKGQSYVIESNVDGIHDFKELIKQPVFDDEGNITGIVALINDVTETELLKLELEKRARTDELTGLGNRRAFDAFVDAQRCDDDYPMAVISADCDRLKLINDTYGHLVGDEYIRMAAVVLKSSLPERAHVFRVGGDEFVAFIPQTSVEQARDMLDEIRHQCGVFKLPEHAISISLGIASLGDSSERVLDAVRSADSAMYTDKAARKCQRDE